MKLTPPTAPLPPFWAAVRRRHPDVDLVVLPDEQPVPEPAVDDAAVHAAVERVTATVRDLADDAPDTPAAVAYGPTEGTVVARARVSAGRPDGHEVLGALRRRLEADGWEVRRLEGEVLRLVGRRDGLQVRASYAGATGGLLLEVASDPLPVGKDRARGLVRR